MILRDPSLSPSGGTDERPLSNWKRILDVGVCLVAMPLLGAATLYAAAVTSITSPGPLYFRQVVTRRDGRRIGLLRMRTMHVTSRPHGTRRQTPYFPGGRWLHHTGLADLPQIINVLRGELSVMAPGAGIERGGDPHLADLHTPPSFPR